MTLKERIQRAKKISLSPSQKKSIAQGVKLLQKAGVVFPEQTLGQQAEEQKLRRQMAAESLK